MSQKSALVLLSALVILIGILFYVNLVVLKERIPVTTTIGDNNQVVPCPLLPASGCRHFTIIPHVPRKEFCFRAKPETKIVSPIEGEVNYGRVSFGEKIGQGNFYPMLKIAWGNQKVSLIFNGMPKENLRLVKVGEEVGTIKGNISEKGYKCSLILFFE